MRMLDSAHARIVRRVGVFKIIHIVVLGDGFGVSNDFFQI